MVQGDEIQPIVDALAARLARSVAVDDPSIRLIAASRHFGDEDQVRVRSVLDRDVPTDLLDWVMSQGVSDWTQPGWLDANTELGIEGRLCAPVRCNEMLLGFLWLIDRTRELDLENIQAASEAADAVGVVLYRRMLLHERERSQAESAVRLLISPEREDRHRAIAELRDEQLLADTTYVTVLVVEVKEAPGHDTSVALAASLEYMQRTLPPQSTVTLVQHHRAIVVLASPRPHGDLAARDLGERLRTRFIEITSGRNRCVVGISASRCGLDTVADSHREASTAVRAARLLPMFGEIASWSTLGPFELLLRIDFDQLTQELPLPGIKDFLANEDYEPLVATAEEFLDRAGDVSNAAYALHVHRTTLYHRLKRIENVTGLALDNGLDRLTLHLALKLARLNATSPSFTNAS